jgi:hypothetical protein
MQSGCTVTTKAYKGVHMNVYKAKQNKNAIVVTSHPLIRPLPPKLIPYQATPIKGHPISGQSHHFRCTEIVTYLYYYTERPSFLQNNFFLAERVAIKEGNYRIRRQREGVQ